MTLIFVAAYGVLFYAVMVVLVALTGPHHPTERAEYSRKQEQQP